MKKKLFKEEEEEDSNKPPASNHGASTAGAGITGGTVEKTHEEADQFIQLRVVQGDVLLHEVVEHVNVRVRCVSGRLFVPVVQSTQRYGDEYSTQSYSDEVIDTELQ